MGLYANIPAIESAHALATAKALSVAFGDAHVLASCIYQTTGDARLAQRVEVEARVRQHHNG